MLMESVHFIVFVESTRSTFTTNVHFMLIESTRSIFICGKRTFYIYNQCLRYVNIKRSLHFPL